MTSYNSDGSDFCDIFRTSKERAMVPYIKKRNNKKLYLYFKNSLIIHKRVVSLYKDKDFPSFTLHPYIKKSIVFVFQKLINNS